MTRIGTGFVEIEADFGPFWRNVSKEMGGSSSKFERAGRDAARSFSKGFGGSSKDLDIGGGAKRGARDLDAFGGAAAGATATIGGFRIALAALVPVTIGFGGAAVAATSALAPLVGLAAAAGNALGAAAQGMGVFKLASMGVADALKEQVDKHTKAASAAVSNAGQQRAAARAIQAAQDQVRNATRALDEALKDERLAVAALGPAYTATRMRLTDLREAVVDANLSLKGAALAATDAKRALSDLLRGPDPRVLAEGHRKIEQAIRGEQDAVLDLTAAQQAYVDLFKPADALDIADARDAITDATRNEERARLNLNKQVAETNAILAAEPRRVTDEQRAKARLDLADAENAVGDASRETTRARQRLGELEAPPDQAAIEAARRRIGDAEYGVAQAAQATVDARTDLAEVEKPADALEVAKARYDVAVAENALTDAERDRGRVVRELTEADRLGIERAPEIVAAREDVRQATRAVEDAERDAKRASQALGDAQLSAKESMASTAVAATNLNEKLNKLPPAAQAFVRELVSMKPKLDAIRQTAAQGFFPGATEGLKAAMGSFDEVNTVVGQTATVLGEAARKSGELVGSPAFGKDIVTIGGNNAKVIDTLGEALRHVISALRHVMVAAGPLTQWLADVVNKWALNAAVAAKSGRETGKLADFFEKTRAITERLGSVIGHLASGLLGLGKAGFQSGNDIWASIDRAAKRFDAWANSDEGQRKLKDFFREARELAAALVPVIAGIGSGLAIVALKALPLTEILRILGPLTDEVVVAFVSFRVATMAWAAAAAVAAFATGGWTTAFWALDAAIAVLLSPVVLITAAIVAVGAALYLAWTKSETFQRIVTTVFNAVKDAAVYAFGLIKKAAEYGLLGPLGLIISRWQETKNLLGSIWGGIRSAADVIWGGIRTSANVIWGGIKAAIVDPIRAAAGLVSDIVGGIRDRVRTVFNDIVGFAVSFGKSVAEKITSAFAGVGGVIADFAIQILKVIDLIPGVSMKDAIKGVRSGAKELGFTGYARGGAFARTGGIVDSPIVLMGEEAPTHPEFVIPTNPAYRERAQALLLEAWGRIGFAQGGVYGKSELAALWKRANPGLGDANLMAAIALAESGGNARAHNPSGATGLWQILGNPFPGDAYDPVTNAKMAGAKFRTQGLGAWEAYTNGAYRKFTGDSGGGGILGAITGAIGDLLSKGADFILGKLPGVGSLPDWLKGTGTYLLEQVTDWIKDKVSDVIGLAGGDGVVGGGVSGSIKGAMALAREMGLSITSTTGGQHAKNSWHYKGRAADVAGSPSQMAAFFNAALAKYGSNLLELFYDPLGAIDNGKRIPAIGGHSDHVHIALAQGGILGGADAPPFAGSFATGGVVPGPAGSARLIEAHAGEAVLPNGMQLHADIYIGGQRINEIVDVQLQMRDRSTAATWRAGKL